MAIYPDTRERLMVSLKELLYKRSINDISVADIADNAGLSSRTFYNHFRDKYELLSFFYNDSVEKLWFKGGKRNSLKEFFLNVENYLCEGDNYRGYVNALTYYGQNDLRTEVENRGVKDLIRLLEWTGYPDPISSELCATMHFFMCGISRLIDLYALNHSALNSEWLFSFWLNCLPVELANYLAKEPCPA